jgi:hypothetical protein
MSLSVLAWPPIVLAQKEKQKREYDQRRRRRRRRAKEKKKKEKKKKKKKKRLGKRREFVAVCARARGIPGYEIPNELVPLSVFQRLWGLNW